MWREFEAAQLRRKDRIDRDLLLAWHIAALERQKKLPTLASLFQKSEPMQSVQQQRAALSVISEQYGIPLRKAGEKKPMKPRPLKPRSARKVPVRGK